MPQSASDQQVLLGTRASDLAGVGRYRAQCFARLGIETVADLLRHVPIRYEQEAAESTIEDLPTGSPGSVRGTIVATRFVPASGGSGGGGAQGRFEATLQDHRLQLYLVWFNAAYLCDRIHPGMVLRVGGTAKPFGGRSQMVNPQWQRLDDSEQTPARGENLRPIYPATEDLTSRLIETLIAQTLGQVVDQLDDPLDKAFISERAMPSLAQAYQQVHQPKHEDDAPSGRRRLAYNELLLMQLGIAVKRYDNQHRLTAPALHWSPAIDAHIRGRFLFTLTEAQDKVIHEITVDLQRTRPMNRLLQGDVGSGKTVVALYALLMAVADRKQGALMVPTQLLAEQHLINIKDMLADSTVRVALLTGQSSTLTGPKRRQLLENIRTGRIDIVIGTQALLTESVVFSDLGVVVVDEQHRFGVLQRAAFRMQPGPGADQGDTEYLSPHYLVMTATPIPRTLSLTLFGDLDVSTIDQLPPGRRPVTTRVVGPDKANRVYDYLATRTAAGQQAYVVLPAIDEQGDASRAQLKNVKEHTRLLQRKMPDCTVAAIHGQLDTPMREKIMHQFRRGDIRVLVATTVIEVGVDVPHATMMVVEHAERFGLAQLHQLRGRIGRGTGGGSHHSVCVFIAETSTTQSQQRMDAIASTSDGFAIAERDLEIRGMGDFFGTRQHGLPPLRIARIIEDMDLLQMARRDAARIIADDPRLQSDSNQLLCKILLREYGQTLSLIDVG